VRRSCRRALETAGNFSQFLPQTSGAVTSCGQTLSAADKAAGDFIVCNPTTRLPYSGNIITDPLDTAAQNVLKSLPAANAGTALSPSYIGAVPLPAHYYEYMGKIDHQLSDKQRLFGSYFYLTGLGTVFNGTGNMPWETQMQVYSLDVANLSDTITLAPNKVNQVWATYTLSRGGRVNSNTNSLATFGSSFVGQGPLSLPNINVTNYFNLSNAIQGPKAQTNFYSLRDLYIWNVGKHSLQLGGEASLNKDITVSDLNNYGTYTFASSASARTGNALSDYMLGLLSGETQDAPVTSLDNSFFYSLFAQDDWRVSPRVTINAGLRWDIQTPPTDPQNKFSTFVPGRQSVVNPLMPLGELVVGDPGVTRGIVALRDHNISPRLGVAWDAFGTGKTSVRAGAGIFYGGVSGNEWNTPSGAYPFTLRYTFGVPGTLSSPYKNTPSPFPFNYTPGKVQAAPAGTSLSVTAENFQWPVTYQMNVSVQQELAKSFVVGIAEYLVQARNPDTRGKQEGIDALKALSKLRRPPDAIWCYNDVIATGVIAEAGAQGIRIPEDLAVIGCGNLHFDDEIRVPLSSIHQRSTEIGEKAANLVLELISETSSVPEAPRHVIIRPKLVARASTSRTG
jgi:hypothetical protein